MFLKTIKNLLTLSPIVEDKEFQKLRSKFPYQVIVVDLDKINSTISLCNITADSIALLYDICLDYAEKNDLEFLQLNIVPRCETFVTFKIKK